ncbi:MAG: FIST C-terminal domain-containing protein [Myxococcales bacterium]|nr:FIST C-terminal domain-containing protein [Myxococcales bacterium]
MSLRIKRAGSSAADPAVAVAEVFAGVHQPDAALTIFYCSSRYDLPALAAAMVDRFGADAPLLGCTTAAEIAPTGYHEGSLTAVSLAGAGLAVRVERIDALHAFELEQGAAAALRARDALTAHGGHADATNTFAFLLADGLASQEEALVTSIYHALGGIQLCGGSAGDGVRFEQTHLFHGGRFHTDCALLTLVRSPAPFRVFKTEHFVPSSEQLVVTGADPGRRVVTEINGEPAAVEYARICGVPAEALTPLVFATHPVVVTLGGSVFVRSIQKVNPDGSLTFFCAIDEGIVLRVARGGDMVENLADAFAGVVREIGVPALVLGCDCVLRYLEIEQGQFRPAIDALMTRHNVIGFATYGEQFNAMHVNQTFTGVAIAATQG